MHVFLINTYLIENLKELVFLLYNMNKICSNNCNYIYIYYKENLEIHIQINVFFVHHPFCFYANYNSKIESFLGVHFWGLPSEFLISEIFSSFLLSHHVENLFSEWYRNFYHCEVMSKDNMTMRNFSEIIYIL